MTNSQRKQLAKLYKARERELVTGMAEMLLESTVALLALTDVELRKQLEEARDELAQAKADGWPRAGEFVLPSESDHG